MSTRYSLPSHTPVPNETDVARRGRVLVAIVALLSTFGFTLWSIIGPPAEPTMAAAQSDAASTPVPAAVLPGA